MAVQKYHIRQKIVCSFLRFITEKHYFFLLKIDNFETIVI